MAAKETMAAQEEELQAKESRYSHSSVSCMHGDFKCLTTLCVTLCVCSQNK